MAAFPPRRFAVARRRAPATSERLCGLPARPAHSSLPVPFSGRSWPLPIMSTGPRSDGPHHQAGIGPAEAEAVVEHSLDRTLLGEMRDEIDSRGPFARIREAGRRRHDLVADGEYAEDRLHRARAAEQ